ncbi:hypothetical protein AB0I60_02210 [Actinosynnema sp. NPDC050436]
MGFRTVTLVATAAVALLGGPALTAQAEAQVASRTDAASAPAHIGRCGR